LQEVREMAISVKGIRPLSDRVLVEPIEKEEVTPGGIVLPETAKEKPQEGVVLAAGPGRLLDNGERAPMEVKVKDHVLYAKYSGTEFKKDDKKYLILNERDLLAVLK
jgi:chaperonin GroES